MKIAVAMCTYNGAAYLKEQLESLLAQARLPDEMVICDDGSNDGQTLPLLQAFAATAPFAVRVEVNEKTLGSTKNFEKAIGLCQSDVISLCDQDDVWHTFKLQRIEEAFTSSPQTGMVFTDAEVVDEALQPLGGQLSQITGLNSKVQEHIHQGRALQVLVEQNHVAGNCLAFRARFRPLILPIPDDLTLLHDGWIALLISAVAPIAYIPEPLVLYRQHVHQQNGAGIPIRNGISRMRDSELWASFLATPPEEGAARKFESLDQRLSTYSGDANGEAREHLRRAIYRAERRMWRAHDKHAHRYVRSALPSSRLRRTYTVCRELKNLRYQRYSKGVLAALKDVIGR